MMVTMLFVVVAVFFLSRAISVVDYLLFALVIDSPCYTLYHIIDRRL